MRPKRVSRSSRAKILAEYDHMLDEFALTVIDASRSIEEQQYEMRGIVQAKAICHHQIQR